MERRRFLQRCAGFGLLAAGLPALGRADDEVVAGPEVPDRPLRQVSRHVWIVAASEGFPTPENHGLMCNMTFIRTARGVVVVDSGASLQIGRMGIRQLRKLTRQPVVAVINTHYHGDHWMGNHAFGERLPIYAHPGTIEAVAGQQGRLWSGLLAQATNQATAGTRIVPPNRPLAHGDRLDFGDVTLRMHHYGKVHTPADICVEVVEDQVTCVGDIAMDRRIANMDDGSYLGTFKAYDALEQMTRTRIWLPAHGRPGAGVLQWNRALFEGIYRPCEQAVRDGRPLEEAKAIVLQDPRVASRAAETEGFAANIGKYVSIAYLEAEAAAF